MTARGKTSRSRLPLRSFRLQAGGCAVALVACLAGTAPAQAAPYCLQIVGLPPQCMFGDVVQCHQESLRASGRCTVNPREVQLPKAPAGRFCLVQNGPVIQCSYPDRRTCDEEADRRLAVCADTAPGTPDVDIFRR